MELLIERKYKKDTYTVGRFFIDGERICETIEDKDRGLTQDMKEEDIRRRKVYGQTAIPTGRYVVGFTYSPKFSQCSYAKGGGKIPLVYGVKGFNSIRFHAGNYAGNLVPYKHISIDKTKEVLETEEYIEVI